MLYAGQEALQRARLIAGNGGGASLREFPADDSQSQDKLKLSFLDGMRRLYFEAGLEKEKFENSLLIVFLLSLMSVASAIVFQKLYFLITLFIVPGLYLLYLNRIASQRARAFEKDYPALLISLASSIRTGLDPLVALMHASSMFQKSSEVTKAIEKFSLLVDSGVSEQKAIRMFASDISHPDIELFRITFSLARSEGSSLGECLHRLARVTRQRQSFRRKIRSAIAMQKLSAWGISGCAVVIGIIEYVTNPKGMTEAIAHPIGSKVLIAGLCLISGGLMWMLNMTKART